MTDETNLERRYRRLLAWYPRTFRRENGQEILDVLMAGARHGQSRPGLVSSADLITSGLRMRLNPRGPRSAPTVRAAVRLMYAGAAVTAVSLIIATISLASIGRRAATLRVAGRNQPFPVAVTVGIGVGLVMIALWLWMARASSAGRHWARIVSTVLFGLATLYLLGSRGVAQMVFATVMWLVGLGVVWLLWRPTSSAFFQGQDVTQVGHGA
jgi:hypothetical protein